MRSPLIKSSLKTSSLSCIRLNKLFEAKLATNCLDKSELALSAKPISIGSLSPSFKPTIPNITRGKIKLKRIYCLFLKKILNKYFG